MVCNLLNALVTSVDLAPCIVGILGSLKELVFVFVISVGMSKTPTNAVLSAHAQLQGYHSWLHSPYPPSLSVTFPATLT